MVFLSTGGRTGVKFPGQFLKNGLAKIVAQLETRIISKNEPNQSILQEVIAKISTVPNEPVIELHHIQS